MKILCRDPSGQWVHWRVGRRRGVWIGGGPTGESLFHLHGLESECLILLILFVPFFWLAKIIVFLLATAVMWPFRFLTGRWTVVAYELNDPTERPAIRRKVRGRKAADALAREWATIIKRDGTLDPAVAESVLVPAGQTDRQPSPSDLSVL
ncbi:hypothetical protein [Actinoplanes sp. NPDC026670]|uniref:hypothetical protein n=1 Tax=Actinoplanes sp. NPDC026670 TaxID=3154700 RepID=UPI0033CCB34C